jgi:hypothetical protein
MAQLGPNTTYWYSLTDRESGHHLKVNDDSTLSLDPIDSSHKFSFINSSPEAQAYMIFSHTTRRFLELRNKDGKIIAAAAWGSPWSVFSLYDDGSPGVNKIGGAITNGRWCNTNNYIVDSPPWNPSNSFILTSSIP